ncbi:MAG: S24/S26 family peptidase [Pseudomonadota bacterium]
MGLRLVRAVGNSMAPRLPNGSYALFRNARRVSVGDTVLADHPRFGAIIKTVTAVHGGGVELAGADPRSTAAERLGPLPKSAVRAKLVCVLHRA